MSKKRLKKRNTQKRDAKQVTVESKKSPKLTPDDISIEGDLIADAPTIEKQLGTLNMLLGNYLDLVPNNNIIEQKPSDNGTGTVDMRTFQFTYNDDTDDFEEPMFNLDSGYVFVDLLDGSAGEHQYGDTLE